MTKPTIMLIPGNGGSHIETDHWYAWVRGKLIGQGYHVIASDMPDPVAAHASVWLPHIAKTLAHTPDAIIIGHSSGGVAALRYLETHRLTGAIVIGINYTDLGDISEQESGYYATPWQWDKIKAHANWIVQFASTDDPYIPLVEPRFIHEQLNTEYHELPGRGHYMLDHSSLNRTFPEIIEVMHQKTA